MFTVKATYRNETRKFSFPTASFFPSYTELCHELYRVFPISQDYYLSKLLFSPDATKPSRVLLRREVHTAEDYAACVAPFHGRTWSRALLRFDVYDETPHKAPSVPSIVSDSNSTTQRSLFDTYSSSTATPGHGLGTPQLVSDSSVGAGTPPSTFRSHIPPPPIFYPSAPITSSGSPFRIPPPPVLYPRSPAKTTTLPSLPTLFPQVSRLQEPPFHQLPPIPMPAGTWLNHGHPVPSSTQSAQSVASQPQPQCCHASQCKSEVQSVLEAFKVDLERIISSQRGQTDAPLGFVPDASHKGISTAGRGRGYSTSSSRSQSPRRRSRSRSMPYEQDSRLNGRCTRGRVFSARGALSRSPSPFRYHGLSRGSHIEHPRRSVSPRGRSYNRSRSSSPIATRSHGVHTSAPAVHNGVVCDICDRTIVGVRHKCLDCPDYDLCTSCIEDDGAERHNAFHEFFEISEPGRVVVHTVFSGDGERDSINGGNSNRNDRARSVQEQEPVVAHNASCDMCGNRIRGDRYKCLNCPDYDTCASCFAITSEQHPGHGFVIIRKADDLLVRNLLSLDKVHFATCNECNQRICGSRYKCMHADCPDYDLCQNCEALPIPVHPPRHPMLKLRDPDAAIPLVQRRPQGARAAPITTSSPPVIPKSSEPEGPGETLVDFSSPVGPRFVVPSFLEHRAKGYEPEYVSSVSSLADVGHSAGEVLGNDDTLKAPEIEEPVPSAAPVSSDINFIAPSTESTPAPSSLPSMTFDLMWDRVVREFQDLSDPRRATETLQQVETTTDSPIPAAITAPEDSTSALDKALRELTLTEAAETEPEMAQRSNTHSFPTLKQMLSDLISAEPPANTAGDDSKVPGEEVAAASVPSLSAVLVAGTTTDMEQPVLPVGAEFVKSWRVRNSGDIAWPETTELHWTQGERFFKHTDVHVGAVAVGAEVDILQPDLRAPEAPGTYWGWYSLHDGIDQLFGQPLLVTVKVVEANHLTADGSSGEDSLASSVVIMPQSASSSPVREGSAQASPSTSPVTAPSHPSSAYEGSDDGSEISVISMPSSSDDEDDAIWEDSRSHVVVSPREHVRAGMEYVLLYDENSSEEE
ncbi:hypothetical protein PLICRDRAFT_35617 [Plicaturopsis crispa FD-325 SS-3]|nr:hypothetical protein PLICRDRAFT_35617 [Plicaturopsis crispa FD-325 SS-3]